MKRIAGFFLGLVLICLAVPGAVLSYHLLPPGRYPAVIIGIGALPPLLLGGLLIRKAAPGYWEFHRRHTGISALAIIVIAFLMLMIVAFVIDSEFR